MEFVFFIIVLLVSVLAEGIIGVRFNMAGIRHTSMWTIYQ